MTKEIAIYKDSKGDINFQVDTDKETLWASLNQIADVFGRDKSVISRHIKDIYSSGELSRKSTVAKNATVQTEGGRKVERSIERYNLDVIISVGYRVNSKQATRFRQWATKVLKSHVIKGYTINPNRVQHNYNSFLSAVEKVRNLLPEQSNIKNQDTLELVKLFASTWFSLDAYDKSEFKSKKLTKRQVVITGSELHNAILDLKQNLLSLNEATELFAQEREKGSVAGIIGNVFQSFGGKDVYGSIEEKAAHLLYFIVKNHPFSDGNKRSGALSFIWFLRKAKVLDTNRMTPEALTAITLLVAESSPKDKDQVVGLIVMLLSR
ncbi:MAG: virulence protein RhuM/Fic/DOC family protein [bacterium]